MSTAAISEAEFARIIDGLLQDRESIIKHNPIGTAEETLLWMLLGVLTSYLDLSDIETPCFTSIPTAGTYRDAIKYVLTDRRKGNFNVEGYLATLVK